MSDARRLDRIEAKQDEIIANLYALREEVAGYRATIRIMKWVFSLVTLPTMTALVWILRKVGIIAS